MAANDLRMYRSASALAPYARHPELTQFHRQLEECALELAAVGALARELGIRLSSHPGQYTVLNSEHPAVVDNAVAELEVQVALLDALGQGPERVKDLTAGSGLEFEDAGLRELKGIPETWHLFRVVHAAA